ncbi:MAG: CBS domain-containing protein [Pseudomonadales bacterium]|nr:CBS domain-containing protein [Pseudomonadales bacterium]
MTSPKILVRDHMKSAAYTFAPTTSVEEVVKILVKNKIIGAPVIDADKKLLGFITEQDCLKQMLNDSYYCEDRQNAEDIMRCDPLSVSPNDDIMKLAENMTQKLPKIYPVVEEGRVIGLITRHEVLKALSLARVQVCSTK